MSTLGYRTTEITISLSIWKVFLFKNESILDLYDVEVTMEKGVQ